MKPPAFQFYADDFLGGTSDMTTEEVGAYIRLLCNQWTKGGLPDDDTRLVIMAGQCQASSLAKAKTKFGICEDGALRNARMEHERQKQDAYRQKQASNGSKRWVGNAKPDAVAMPSLMPNACSPSPSPLPIEKKKRRDSKTDMTDGEWLEHLKAKPELQRIDVGHEYGKMLEWCQRKNEKPTRRRFEIWVGKAEPGLELAAKPTADQRGPFTPQPHRGLHTWEDYDNLMASL